MTIARKILDVHGQDPAELAREIARLPHGRYVLVPENELDTDDDPVGPTPEQAGELRAALADVARVGSQSLEDFARHLDARIRGAATRP
ncbi:MAG: hypothetical protein WCJ30_11580 [Deltaproteobacteria bacterium]